VRVEPAFHLSPVEQQSFNKSGGWETSGGFNPLQKNVEIFLIRVIARIIHTTTGAREYFSTGSKSKINFYHVT